VKILGHTLWDWTKVFFTCLGSLLLILTLFIGAIIITLIRVPIFILLILPQICYGWWIMRPYYSKKKKVARRHRRA